MEHTQPYAEMPIKGTPYTRMLAQGTALVLEGGGTRGFYSSGVFEAFMDEGLMFPYVIGVSAGAANALTYLSGQRLRSREIVEKYVGRPQYLGARNLLLNGSFFNFPYVFFTIPETQVFWDKAMFKANEARFLTGATDCATGEAVWYEKEVVQDDFTPAVASCSVPLISKIVHYGGKELLDGGLAAPIPIEKSIADGNTRHVVVLTRNEGYRKEPEATLPLVKLRYRKYPKFVDMMLRRHEVYNRSVAKCEQLEREGKAVIIRPLQPITVGRAGNDVPALLRLYDEGHNESAAAVEKILRMVEEK